MPYADVSWLVGARLRRVKSALWGSIVEAKLRRLERALKANFDPNQPRVPAGNPHGGEWTGTGGSGGSDDTQVAQNARGPHGTGRVRLGNGQLVQPTPAQAARLTFARARAAEALRKVRELDPNWSPTPSFRETIEGEITHAQQAAREAEARFVKLQKVGAGPGPFASESIPARSPSRSFTVEERTEINQIGSQKGCHTCGRRSPGTTSGNFIPDHQPPTALNSSGRAQQLYPQCLTCSLRQGGWIRGRGSR